jgi:hypothetical protein
MKTTALERQKGELLRNSTSYRYGKEKMLPKFEKCLRSGLAYLKLPEKTAGFLKISEPISQTQPLM